MNETHAARRFLTFGAAINAFVYAIIVFIVGVSLPTLTEKFGLTNTQKGMLISVQNVAILLTILCVGPILDRIGQKPVLITGALLIALAVIGIGLAPSYLVLLGILFILGVGAGCNNIGGSTLITDLYPQNPGRALNLITSTFGAGAIGIPLLGSLLIQPIGFLGYLSILTIIACIPFIVFTFSTFPKAKQVDKFVLHDMFKVIAKPIVFFIGAVLFFYVALEISTAGWLKDYVIAKFGLTDRTSGFVLTGFSVMLMLGRVLAGFILDKLKGMYLVVWCALISIVGLVLMIMTDNLLISIIGVMITGLAYAPIYPTSLGQVGENFQAYIATIMGTVTTLAFLGAICLPYLIGRLGGNLNVMILAAVLMLVFQLLLVASIRRKSAAPEVVEGISP
jgi:fucose permease